MKYFIDTEFIEGFSKWTFAKNRHFIDLISIGIIAEDGQTYYAISNEYNYNDADVWVKENVILPMYIDAVHGDARNNFNAKNFHKYFGKSNKQIAQEVEHFVLRYIEQDLNDGTVLDSQMKVAKYPTISDIEFYGYYSDYDWVVFCSLFGRMIDLPKGFPMYCKDLKQTFDEAQKEAGNQDLKSFADYPKQENEHNALDDAKWNYELYKFLQTL